MKKIWLIPLVLLATACATVQQNIDARKLLANCKYEYAGVDFVSVDLDGLVPTNVDLRVKVKVTNPNKKDVALDHASLAFSLDGNNIVNLDHKKFVRVAAGKAATEPVAVGLPLKGILASAGASLSKRPEFVQVHADLWVTLLIGKDNWETPIVIPVDFEVPIPWKDIDKAIEKKKNELAKEAKEKAAKAANDLLGKVKKP